MNFGQRIRVKCPKCGAPYEKTGPMHEQCGTCAAYVKYLRDCKRYRKSPLDRASWLELRESRRNIRAIWPPLTA